MKIPSDLLATALTQLLDREARAAELTARTIDGLRRQNQELREKVADHEKLKMRCESALQREHEATVAKQQVEQEVLALADKHDALEKLHAGRFKEVYQHLKQSQFTEALDVAKKVVDEVESWRTREAIRGPAHG